jgi:hypothetical protein
MFSRLIEWGRSQVPTRERLERNRFVAPLAAKPELWRFTVGRSHAAWLSGFSSAFS